ncbi:MAG: leucine-rich repeat domain-containing protein [Chloroflexota bacterium]
MTTKTSVQLTFTIASLCLLVIHMMPYVSMAMTITMADEHSMPAPQRTHPDTVCDFVSQMPTSECEALVAIYNNTDGGAWTDNTNWLETNLPCDWTGVTCTNGHVTLLNFDPNDNGEGNGLIGILPAEISNLTNLSELWLSGNQVVSLPSEIGNLTHLTKLYVTGNQLISLPSSIGGLENLTELFVDGNRLVDVPAELGNLSNVTTLSLANNSLTSLAFGFEQLTHLQSFSLARNDLTTLPETIGDASSLAILDLSSTGLRTLPERIGDLSNLLYLSLYGNAFTEVPAVLGSLPNLLRLYLSANQLTDFTPQAETFPNLTELYLTDNQLTTLSPEVETLSTLTKLHLGGNQLASVPSTLGNLKQLEELSLAQNQLTTLPEEISGLTNLRKLYLEQNELTMLPSGIGSLFRLTELYLYTNALTNLPDEIGNLFNLNILMVGDNQLVELPDAVGTLTALTYLSVPSNQLLGLPINIDNLSNLGGLDVRYNRITITDADVLTFVNALGENWVSTQTVAPTALAADVRSDTTVQLAWLPILFQDVAGVYEISASIIMSDGSEGPAIVLGETKNQSVATHTLTGLSGGTTYKIQVHTKTDPHAGVEISEKIFLSGTAQRNELLSERAAITVTMPGVAPTATSTQTVTATPSPTASFTPTPTETPTETATVMPTASSTPTMPLTATMTATPSPTSVPTETATETSTETATATSMPSPTSTPIPSLTPTSTEMATMPPTAIPTVTPTALPTATATPTMSPTPSSTPTTSSTPTPTPTHTPSVSPSPTATLSGSADAYEFDDNCEDAVPILLDGVFQEHTLHKVNDQDWTTFTAPTNGLYRVEVTIPNDSRADIDLAYYTDCELASLDEWTETFAPGVVIDIEASVGNTFYIKTKHVDAGVHGPDVSYNISVRALSTEPTVGAVIIVAGRLESDDELQENIHRTASRAYELFIDKGISAEDILFLATDPELSVWHDYATETNLHIGITEWAKERVSQHRMLTLYLIDHGAENKLYLDEVKGQSITPERLDAWLTALEDEVEGLKSNIIIDACHSGSFIGMTDGSISKENRLVITSTNARADAYASDSGIQFSDAFITYLGLGGHLAAAFDYAKENAQNVFTSQEPWMDGNGNGVPNEAGDVVVASRRDFEQTDMDIPIKWPPFIAEVMPPLEIVDRSGTIQVEVRDDKQVDSAWAVIYPPDYKAPQDDGILNSDKGLPRILLERRSDLGTNMYTGLYPGFSQAGVYHIMVYAKDLDDLEAQPNVLAVDTSHHIFLPVVQYGPQ